MSKKRKKKNKGIIADIKLWESHNHTPLFKGRIEVPTIEELVELLKRKFG